MESITKGVRTEITVMKAFIDRGCRVLTPVGDGHPYHLAIELPGGPMLRVQCKTARLRNGCVAFNAHTTDHGRGRLSYRGRADVLAACLPPSETVYVVPVEEVSTFHLALRVRPPRNNQRRRVRLAADYEIDRWSVEDLARYAVGGVAAAAA